MCTPMTTATVANISVTFSQDGGPKWSFVGGDLPGATSAICYAVIWTLTGPSNMTLSSIKWKGPAPPSLPSTCTMPAIPSGSIAVGVDNTNTTQGNSPQKFKYKLKITYTDPDTGEVTEHSSDDNFAPDPEIVLEPPGV